MNKNKLQQVNKAEELLRSQGFNEVRVRSQGLAARIELPSKQIQVFLESLNRQKTINYFLSIGFTSVSIDLEGLISGKLTRNIKATKE